MANAECLKNVRVCKELKQRYTTVVISQIDESSPINRTQNCLRFVITARLLSLGLAMRLGKMSQIMRLIENEFTQTYRFVMRCLALRTFYGWSHGHRPTGFLAQGDSGVGLESGARSSPDSSGSPQRCDAVAAI
jgi:hypothetical protein